MHTRVLVMKLGDVNELTIVGEDEENEMVPWRVLVGTILLALLSPYQFLITPSENILQIVAPLFVYFPLWNYLEMFDVGYIINTLPFIALRFIFAFQVGRYYKKAISKAKLTVFGFLGEVPSLVISVLFLLQPILSAYPLVIGIPTPIALVIIIFLIREYPQPVRPLSWNGKKKVLDWWPEIDIPKKE